MTKEKELTRIFKIAVARGWKPFGRNEVSGLTPKLAVLKFCRGIERAIFSHDFLKSYFGKELITTAVLIEEGYEYAACSSKVIAWRFRAQGLVLAEDRIEYLWKNRNTKKKTRRRTGGN